MSFDVTGWTNPTDTSTQDFSLATYFDDGSTLYGIENFPGLELGAADGAVQTTPAETYEPAWLIVPRGWHIQIVQ